jgi:hypothetical protein
VGRCERDRGLAAPRNCWLPTSADPALGSTRHETIGFASWGFGGLHDGAGLLRCNDALRRHLPGGRRLRRLHRRRRVRKRVRAKCRRRGRQVQDVVPGARRLRGHRRPRLSGHHRRLRQPDRRLLGRLRGRLPPLRIRNPLHARPRRHPPPPSSPHASAARARVAGRHAHCASRRRSPQSELRTPV